MEEERSRDIVIRLNRKSAKRIMHVLLIIVLIAIIAIQFYLLPNCSKCDATDLEDNSNSLTGAVVANLENTEVTVEGYILTDNECVKTTDENLIEYSSLENCEEDIIEYECEKDSDCNERELCDDNKCIIDEDFGKLPITGEVFLIIDKINIDPKPDIENYARVTSVTFTINNQNEDFTPKVSGYLKEYEGDEEPKTVELGELEAGLSITDTSAKLTFGYSEPETEHTLILKLYNEKNKLLKTVSKTFKTE